MNIHNVSSIEFIKIFNRVDYINLSEEIYLKNVAKIKKTVKEETVKLLEQFAHDIHYEGPIKEISSII